MTIRAFDTFGWAPLHYSQPKLTAAQRDEIADRRGNGETVRNLAAEYHVSTHIIRMITPREQP